MVDIRLNRLETVDEFGLGLSAERTLAMTPIIREWRDSIAQDVEFVLETYGCPFDLEKALAPRTW